MGERSNKRINNFRRDLNNPEIKMSFNVLLIVMIIFSFLNFIFINLDYQNRKKEYIGIMGTVVARISEENPSLSDKIIPIMTNQISNEDKMNGIRKIKEYGLDEELDLMYFPNLNKSYNRFILNEITLTVLFIVILLMLNYFQYSYFYSIIRSFTVVSKEMLNGEFGIKLSRYKEGDVSRLAQAYNSMAEGIKGNIDKLNKEKVFLVDILQDISHQLKTPLSTLIIYNDIMLDKELSKEDMKLFLKNSQIQLNRMKGLILNLLKQAKLDANAVNFELEEQSLNETIEEVIDILYGKSIEKNTIIKITSNKEIYLKHDRLWLQEALVNIVKNSIEHSMENGEVKISLEDNAIYTRIIVNNKGDNIPEDDLPNIFKRFYKCKNSNKDDSIGIGLSLAKTIIEKHGGYIEAISNEQEGTSFIITFLKY